jgi:V/A-type H+-transporting ATPase subunit C
VKEKNNLFNTIKLSFVNAKIRGLRSKLLSLADYEALIGSKTLQALVRVLKYSDYSKYISKQVSTELDEKDVDRFLNQSFIDSLESLRIVSPPQMRSFLNIVRKRYEVSTLKAILRMKISNVPLSKATLYTLSIGAFTEKLIIDLLNKRTLKILVESLPVEGYKQTLLNVWRDYDRDKILLPLEIALDNHVYNEILNGARRNMDPDDYSATQGEYGRLLDINNISIILRGKILGMNILNIQKMIVREGRYLKKDKLLSAIRARHVEDAIKIFMVEPYENYIRDSFIKYQNTKELRYIENALDRYIRDRAIIILASYPFQVRSPQAYLDLKYYEIMNLKAIILGLMEGLSPTVIREYLLL